MEHPDTNCRKCYSILIWDEKLSTYVDEEGLVTCYPAGQPLGNLGHTWEEKRSGEG